MSERPSDDEVSRLLAGARVHEPMPEQVATRLEGVLAELTAERSSDSAANTSGGVVVPLARRRRSPRVLLAAAAAAVVVAGGGIVTQQLTGSGSDTGDMMSSADSSAADETGSADREPEGRDSSGTTNLDTDGSKSALKKPRLHDGQLLQAPRADPAGEAASQAAPVPELRIAHFAGDAKRAIGTFARTAYANDEAATTPEELSAQVGGARTTCVQPPGHDDTDLLLTVRVDGTAASLLVSRVADKPRERLAVAWSCDATIELARAVVRVR